MKLVALMVSVMWLGVETRPPPPPPPVPAPRNGDQQRKPSTVTDRDALSVNLEYNRYLQEITNVLEDDPDFVEKIKKITAKEIDDGSFVHKLDLGRHNTRTRLEDAKRKELDRIRNLAESQNLRKVDTKHIGSIHTSRFEPSDLKELIQTARKDLEEAERNREEAFKAYEMNKHFDNAQKLRDIKEEDARKAEEELQKQLRKKHSEHERLKHPMTKDQLEEVWEEDDHMDPGSFDPKTFFAMHDLNGDGFLEEDEVRAMFARNIERAYDPKNPEDDMQEREEEFDLMQEHVYTEMDSNKDKLISYEEFRRQTEKEEFEKDPGWDTIEEEDVFTREEYRRFEMERMKELEEQARVGNPPYYRDGIPPVGQPVPIPNQDLFPPGLSDRGLGQQGVNPNVHPQAHPGAGAYPNQGFVPGQSAYNPNQPGQGPNYGKPFVQQQPSPLGNQQQQYQQQPPQFQQPPSHPGGQVQYQQPPSVGQVQYQQPPSVGQVQHQQPLSVGQVQYQKPPSVGQDSQQQAGGQPQFNQQPSRAEDHGQDGGQRIASGNQQQRPAHAGQQQPVSPGNQPHLGQPQLALPGNQQHFQQQPPPVRGGQQPPAQQAQRP